MAALSTAPVGDSGLPRRASGGRLPLRRRTSRCLEAVQVRVRLRLRMVVVLLVGTALALTACGSTPSGDRSSRPSSAQEPHVSSPGRSPVEPAPQASPGPGTGAAAPAATQAPPAAAAAPSAGPCRSGDPLANVYHAYRLHVLKDCITVTGTVAYSRHEDDGDIHVDLSLPPGESSLLDQANIADEHGTLVTEIVPADQPGCTPGRHPPLPPTAYTSPGYSYGTCTGADIATPPVGAQVAVTGPYVLDTDHGWMEVHPVWSIATIGRGTSSAVEASPPAPAPAPASSSAPGPAPAPVSASTGAWCHAGASPSADGYSGDYEVYVHSDQPDQKATASDAGDTWSDGTDSSGYVDIRLYHTSPGMTITVTVGAASCSTTA